MNSFCGEFFGVFVIKQKISSHVAGRGIFAVTLSKCRHHLCAINLRTSKVSKSKVMYSFSQLYILLDSLKIQVA